WRMANRGSRFRLATHRGQPHQTAPRNRAENQRADREGWTRAGTQSDRVGAWRYLRGGNQHPLSHGIDPDRRWAAEDRAAGNQTGGDEGPGWLASRVALDQERPQAGA